MNRLLLLLALLFAPAVYAADVTPTPAPVNQPAAAQKVDYRDAFLQFALDKAKLYSGTLEETVSKGVDVAKEQRPLVFAEWIRWRVWYHALHCIVPLVFVLLFALVGTVGKWDRDRYGAVDDSAHNVRKIAGYLALGAVSMFTFCSLFVDDLGGRSHEKGHVYSLVQVITAPRVYVIEQVIDLAKR